MEAAECGPASLGIILGSYGRFIPLEVLRMECSVNREGTNAKNLIDVGKQYGLDGKGTRMDLDELEALSAPAILFWEFNHFLVLEGFSKNKVFLNDPATGPRSVNREEFNRGFTGIVLLFEPTTEFISEGKPRSLLKEIILRISQTRSSFFYLFLTALLLLLPGLALPALVRLFIDQFVVTQILSWKWQFSLSLFLAFLFGGGIIALQQFVSNRLKSRLSIHFSETFLWHMLKLPIAFYEQRFSGEIVQRILANERVAQKISGDFVRTFFDLSVIFVYGIIILQYNWIIGAIAFAAAFVNIGLFMLIQRSRSNDYAKIQQKVGKWVGSSVSALQQIETVKAAGLEEEVFHRFASGYAENITTGQQIEKKDSLLSAVPILLQGLVVAALLSLGTLFVLEGKLTLGMLAALEILLLSFLGPVNRLVNFGMTMQNLQMDIGRLNDVLDYEVDPLYKREKKRATTGSGKLEGYLEFRSVDFGYNLREPAFVQDLSFTIKPGQRIALVGPSGSGKSTIAKLALGLYRPWKGEILYDGKPIEEVPHEILRHSLSSVDQTIFLFSGTIRENLTFWNPSVSDQMLVQAAKEAGIHEEIILREKGYDSQLLERGENLSGGQKQRLEIARALLYRPSIFIMDEATSSLDSQAEKEISDKIRRRGLSTLIISHRLSTIQDCDEIIVLESGKIVQRGHHEELKEAKGLYRELVRSEKP